MRIIPHRANVANCLPNNSVLKSIFSSHQSSDSTRKQTPASSTRQIETMPLSKKQKYHSSLELARLLGNLATWHWQEIPG